MICFAHKTHGISIHWEEVNNLGIGSDSVKLYLELWQRGFFKTIKSVMDMGSQELMIAEDLLKRMTENAGLSNYSKEKFKNLKNFPGYPRCSTKPFYEMLGVEKYSCIDLSKAHGAIPHDLNYPLEDLTLYGKFDLVTDFGNNEHPFNIGEAYRTMHRLCKPNGYLVIQQQLFGGNGYYNFDQSFFEGIAVANNYKVFFSSYLIDPCINKKSRYADRYHIPASRELLNVIDLCKVKFISICYVLQKVVDADFKYPYQGEFDKYLSKNSGYKLQFLNNPPGRSYSYIPAPLSELTDPPIKITTMLYIIFKRIIKLLKAKLGFR